MSTFVNINNDNTTYNQNGMTAGSRFGQTFTLSADGSDTGTKNDLGTATVEGFAGSAPLESITTLHSNTSGSVQTLTMEIYDGYLADNTTWASVTPIATATANIATVGTVRTPVVFTGFTPPISLTVGHNYTFTVYSANNNVQLYLEPSSAVAGQYTDGYWFNTISNTVNQQTFYDIPFRVTLQGIGGINGDPLIKTLTGDSYYLPINEGMYCLIDTYDSECRLVVNFKTHIRKNSHSYARYVFVHLNGYEFTIQLPGLNRVDTNVANLDDTVNAFKLPDYPTQDISTTGLEEIKRNVKFRRFRMTTKFGTHDLIFSRNKFCFNIHGNISKFLTDKTIGCMVGSNAVMRINHLNYVAII